MKAAEWLVQKIGAVAGIAGGVHRDAAPLGTQLPFVVINKVDGSQVGNAFKDAIMDREIWRVKVVSEGATYSQIYPIANQIRNGLHKQTGDGIVGCTFETNFELREIDDGGEFRSIILEFEILTQ